MDDREKQLISKEKERMLKKLRADQKESDPVVRVKFQSIEDPPAPGKPSPAVSFTFGRYIYKESRKESEPDTALRHGHEYDLPLSVVNHLNSLSIPIYGSKKDPVTGAIMTVELGRQNRFSCVPVDMSSFSKVVNAPVSE